MVAAGSGKDKPLKFLLLAALLALPLPSLAETREERVAAARQYVELALQGFDMEAVIETMYQPILQQVAASGQSLTDAQLASIRSLYLDTYTKPMGALMRDQAEIMADLMTLAEINAILAFYSTPEGRSVMAKLPQLNAAQQPKMRAMIDEKTQVLMPALLEIINGEAPPEPTPQP